MKKSASKKDAYKASKAGGKVSQSMDMGSTSKITKPAAAMNTLKLPGKNRNSIIQEQDEDQHSQSSQRFVKSPM